MTSNGPHQSFVRNSMIDRLRTWAVVLVTLAGAGFYLALTHTFYPIKEWLFWRYAATWLYTALFFVSTACAGWRLSSTLWKSSLPNAERFVVGVTLGVLLFFLGLFTAGCFDGYQRWLFWAWPVALLSYGAPVVVADFFGETSRFTWSHWRNFLPESPLQVVACAFLCLGVLAVYLQVMLPSNLGADCYWYHEPIAEAYVAAGGIRRFTEGWYVGTYPQLASILYVWAFLAPGQLIDHVMLCMHMEFALFLATLLAISVLAARLLGQQRLAFAGAAIFLFPKLFVYDSNLNGGADHILGFFCITQLLVLLRFARQFAMREAVVTGLVTTALVLTKYQAIYSVVPTLVLILLLTFRRRSFRPALVWGLTAFAFSGPHWLKNIIYYRDPVYPLLHGLLPSAPFHQGAANLMAEAYWPRQFDVVGSMPEKLLQTLGGVVTFAFVPNDWGFHGRRPVFGALFTLMTPALPFLRPRLKLLVSFVSIYAAVALWYFINHQDRFLQCLVPAMAAATVSALALAWERGWPARVSVSLLVLVQCVWGADAYFIPSHTMLGDSPFRALGSYLAMGYRGDYEGRYHLSGSSERYAQHLPRGSKVLMHLYDTHLGLGSEFATDSPGWQGAIEYLHTDSPERTAKLLRSLGITHVAWPQNRGAMSPNQIARETVFQRMLHEYAAGRVHVGDWQLAELNDNPRSANASAAVTIIAWLNCNAAPPSGLYTPMGFSQGHPLERFSNQTLGAETLSLLSRANAVIMKNTCGNRAEHSSLASEFTQVTHAGEYGIWVRTRAR